MSSSKAPRPLERAFERPNQRPVGQQPIGAPGQIAVDYEHRVNFDRLRTYRLDRAKAAAASRK